MASPGLDEIVTTTLRNRTGELADNVTRNNALLTRLRSRGRIKKVIDGGSSIVQELEYAMNSTYTRYSGYDPLNISPSDVITAAEFSFKQAAVAVSISGLEELKNAGKERKINLLAARIENAQNSFMNGLAYDVYSDGSLTNQINGLRALIATSPTNTIGGIDANTYTWWRNIAYSSLTDGGAAFSAATAYAQMLALWQQLVRGNDKIDLIVADNNSWAAYNQSLHAIQRITDSNSDVAKAGFESLKFMNSDVVLDGGFQGFSTDPIPVAAGGTAVGGMPASTMFFMNTKYIHWRPHADRDMVPLNPDRFSVNQDAMVKLLGWAGNLTASNRRLQGVLTT